MKKILNLLAYLAAFLAFFLSLIIASFTLATDITPLNEDDKFYLRMLTIYMVVSIIISFLLFYIKGKLFDEGKS